MQFLCLFKNIRFIEILQAKSLYFSYFYQSNERMISNLNDERKKTDNNWMKWNRLSNVEWTAYCACCRRLFWSCEHFLNWTSIQIHLVTLFVDDWNLLKSTTVSLKHRQTAYISIELANLFWRRKCIQNVHTWGLYRQLLRMESL